MGGQPIDTPTKFGEDPSKDLGRNREQTNKRCSNYSMITILVTNSGAYFVFVAIFFFFLFCYVRLEPAKNRECKFAHGTQNTGCSICKK